jgi:hypothetical protein
MYWNRIIIFFVFTFLFFTLYFEQIHAQEGAQETKKGINTEQLHEIISSKDTNEVKSENPFNITIKTDFVSRDILRGIPGNEFFCVQPLLSIDFIGLTLGTVGSYPLSDAQGQTNEFWISYVLQLSKGSFSTTIYDYHLGIDSVDFFNFKGNGEGSHRPELQLEYDGPDEFPIKLFGAYGLYNDPDKSIYLEIGYSSSINDIKWNIFAGVAKGKSDVYEIEENKFSFINMGISVSKTIKITESFSLPLGIDYIINPHTEKSYLVVRFSL